MSDFDFSGISQPDATPTAPIADLSYRGYEGKLHTRAARWWIVSLEMLRIYLRKPGFWGLALLAALAYAVIVVMVYTGAFAMMGAGSPDAFTQRFFQAFSQQQFWLMMIGLMVGSGAIATDNRANALLVYLSKPITKLDYLLGKWMGIFLILYGVTLLPALTAYSYCALSLTGQGFYASDPHLLWRIVFATLVPPVVHASLLIGFSAWSKSARIAGAAYFGLYIVTGIFSGIVGNLEFRAHVHNARLIQSLSVSGAVEGLAQNIYHVTLQVPHFRRHTGEVFAAALAPPPLYPMLALVAGLIVVGILAARAKIRAVEVVRG